MSLKKIIKGDLKKNELKIKKDKDNIELKKNNVFNYFIK